jgi:hypothetical protein
MRFRLTGGNRADRWTRRCRGGRGAWGRRLCPGHRGTCRHQVRRRRVPDMRSAVTLAPPFSPPTPTCSPAYSRTLHRGRRLDVPEHPDLGVYSPRDVPEVLPRASAVCDAHPVRAGPRDRGAVDVRRRDGVHGVDEGRPPTGGLGCRLGRGRRFGTPGRAVRQGPGWTRCGCRFWGGQAQALRGVGDRCVCRLCRASVRR